jgi:pantoate--beta-alanine ligase
MQIIKSLSSLKKNLRIFRAKALSIGFVPTMGALHSGHLSLIRKARKQNNCVVVSIYVNPLQFGAGEDLNEYPRTISQDIRLCRKHGVDILFVPERTALSKNKFRSFTLPTLTQKLCGPYRPGHFKGVAKIVDLLFRLIAPDRAYFGQKDYQQYLVIHHLAARFHPKIQIVLCPTMRTKQGLAFSSRNRYLTPQQTQLAACLYRSLTHGAKLVLREGASVTNVLKKMTSLMIANPMIHMEYLAIVDSKKLEDVVKLGQIKDGILLASAVRIANIRLIDNIIVQPNKK